MRGACIYAYTYMHIRYICIVLYMCMCMLHVHVCVGRLRRDPRARHEQALADVEHLDARGQLYEEILHG